MTVSLRPSGGGRIACRPYPFDLDPLPVAVPARVLDVRGDHPGAFATRWHAVQPEPLRFAYCSA